VRTEVIGCGCTGDFLLHPRGNRCQATLPSFWCTRSMIDSGMRSEVYARFLLVLGRLILMTPGRFSNIGRIDSACICQSNPISLQVKCFSEVDISGNRFLS
jgi:hypothetical protein